MSAERPVSRLRKPRPWIICEACGMRFQQVTERAGPMCPPCWAEQTAEMRESEERWHEWLRGYDAGFRAGADWERGYLERAVANGQEDWRALMRISDTDTRKGRDAA